MVSQGPWASAALASLVERGDAASALPLAEALLDGLRQAFKPDYEHALNAARVLADCRAATGDYEGALALDQELVDRRADLLGEDHLLTLDAAGGLARDLYLLERHEEARRITERTLHARGRALGEDHPQTLASQDQLALILLALDEPWQALRLNEVTWAARKRVLGEGHRDTLTSAYHLALNLAELGEWERARDHLAHVRSLQAAILGGDHPDLAAASAALDRCERELAQRRQTPVPQRKPQATTSVGDMRALTILSVATEWSSSRGGLSTFNRQLCRALAAAGQRVLCMVDSMTEAVRRHAEADGVTLLPAGTAINGIGDGVDVIIGHGRITGQLAQRLATLMPSARRVHFIHMAPKEIEAYKPDGVHAQRHLTEMDLGRDAALVAAVGPRLHTSYALEFQPSRRPVIRIDPGSTPCRSSATDRRPAACDGCCCSGGPRTRR